jgi:flagellar biosynthetic protein FlhB
MAEDRTQTPTKRRRDLARQQGLVARSPELTSSAVLLAAVVLLALWGESMLGRFVELAREPLVGEPLQLASNDEIIGHARRVLLTMFVPISILLGGVFVGSLLVHQAQVRGLWAPGLLAPNPARLWSPAASWGSRATRGAWSLATSAALVGITAWALQSNAGAFQRLSGLDAHNIVASAGSLLRNLATTLAAAVCVLGLIDYLIQWSRLEAQLRLTPDEYREEQKAVDGDPALRARRIRIARAWNRSSATWLEGASLVLTGPGNLVVVLAGGPPPRRITVRGSARGAAGSALLLAAEKARLRKVESAALARHFAQGAATGGSLPPALASELSALWDIRRQSS